MLDINNYCSMDDLETIIKTIERVLRYSDSTLLDKCSCDLEQ